MRRCGRQETQELTWGNRPAPYPSPLFLPGSCFKDAALRWWFLLRPSGPSPGEGIGYPLQYSWAYLVAQLVKNLPAMRDTWV